jgi:hypothetical protein
MSAVQINALTEFETMLRKAMPGLELPSNLVEMMLATMKESERSRLNDFSFVLPTIDQINKSDLKSTVKLLPFMPDRINYMMDQGRCCAIEFDMGLFLPCCKACSEGNQFCKGHVEKPSPFGTYAERLEQWDEGRGVGTMEFTVDGEVKAEITYGEYLLKKKIAPEHVSKALKDNGIMCKLQVTDLMVRPKQKKARGRPSDKKVQAVEDEEEAAPAEAPVKATRVKLSDEEKAEKKAREDAEKAVKKEAREANKKIVAERKAAEEIVKAQKRAEKLEAQLEAQRLKAEALAKGEKPVKAVKPKTKTESPSSSPSPLGTSLDTEYYQGDLDELTHTVANDTEYWISEDNCVYDASKMKVGVVGDEGELELF